MGPSLLGILLTSALLVGCSLPADPASPDHLATAAAARVGDEAARPVEPEVPDEVDLVTALRLGAAPVIDGDLSDWSAASWKLSAAPADYVSTGGSADRPDDLSMAMAARWQPGTLYLAFRVSDDLHRAGSDGSGDAVLIGLDIGHDGGDLYDGDDWVLAWALSPEGPVQRSLVVPPGASPPSSHIAITRADGETRYEVALDASELGIGELRHAFEVRFAALTRDDDGERGSDDPDDLGDGREGDGYVAWASGLAEGSPALFGGLLFW